MVMKIHFGLLGCEIGVPVDGYKHFRGMYHIYFQGYSGIFLVIELYALLPRHKGLLSDIQGSHDSEDVDCGLAV